MQNLNINIQVLLTHIGDELHTNIHFYNNNQKWTTCVRKLAANDPFFENSEVRSHFISKDIAKYNPALVQVNSLATYSVVFCPHGTYVIGPILLPGDIDCLNQLDIYPSEPEFDTHICPVSLTKYVNNVFLLYNLFHDEDDQMTFESYQSLEQYTTKLNLQIRKHVTHMAFDNHELQHRHNPFDFELKDLKAIEEGRLDLFEQLWKENYNVENLSLLSRNPVRNAKYLAITAITLASRAAIRGGVLPETSLNLCDSYIRQIDELEDLSQLEGIAKDAWISFAYLVTESKSSRVEKNADKEHPVINQCKDYVFRHLHEKIALNQIADALHLNATYLTNLFKKQEGISLYQFILDEKINLVKNLLTYSEYSYIDIANYLGFTSQSHLSHTFKQATGMTLKQFRDQFGRKESF